MKRRAWAFAFLGALASYPCASASAQGEVGTESPTAFPVRIDALRITGLVRTRERVVRRELGFAEGARITKEDLALATARLWNTTLFARVRAHVVREKGDPPAVERNTLVVELEDRWTLNPLLSFGSGGGARFFRVGATDNNIAGRFLEAYALYENFDGYHGGLAFVRDPRLFDRRLELMVQADRLIRPRPGFSDQRTEGVVEIAQLFDRDRVRIGVRATMFADRFIAPLDTPPFPAIATETAFVEPRLRIGRIDTVRIRQRGATLEVRPGLGFTTSDVASEYVSLTCEGVGFVTIGERWNVAARIRAANISRVPPHLQLYAGGLDLVRGFPDNFVRTNAFALANLEVRYVAFDSVWVAIIPAVFADAIAARAPVGVAGTAFSAGVGVRIVIPKFVASGLRADLAIPIHANLRTVAPGEERFGPVTPEAELGSVQPSFGIFQFF